MVFVKHERTGHCGHHGLSAKVHGKVGLGSHHIGLWGHRHAVVASSHHLFARHHGLVAVGRSSVSRVRGLAHQGATNNTTGRNHNIGQIEGSITAHGQSAVGELVSGKGWSVDAGGVLGEGIVSDLLAPDVVPEVGREEFAVAIATAGSVDHGVVVSVGMTASADDNYGHKEENRDEKAECEGNDEGDAKIVRPGVSGGRRLDWFRFQF